MNRATLISLAVCITFNACAQEKLPEKIHWMSWDEAIAANSKKPKKIFIDVYTNWCGWCKRMDATTFRNDVIAKIMKEGYYAVKLNAEMKDTIRFNDYTFVNPNPGMKRSAHQLAASLLDNRMSYPTFVIMNEQVKRLQILPGFKTAKAFEPILRFFSEDAFLDTSYEEYLNTFKGEVQ
ncbi:MAG: thioredoxin family protein [Flavobacteriales bacterium]